MHMTRIASYRTTTTATSSRRSTPLRRRQLSPHSALHARRRRRRLASIRAFPRQEESPHGGRRDGVALYFKSDFKPRYLHRRLRQHFPAPPLRRATSARRMRHRRRHRPRQRDARRGLLFSIIPRRFPANKLPSAARKSLPHTPCRATAGLPKMPDIICYFHT